MMMTLLMLALLLGADSTLRGEVLDAQTGKPIPCRLSIRGADGKSYFAKSAAADGSSIDYRKEAFGNPKISEHHVTLSAHPFTVDVPPGKYTVTAQHGKEYLPAVVEVDVGDAGAKIEIKLKRWINMAERGWYSGETHVHRLPDQLPNLMLAEDLNVALPFTSWVVEAYKSPKGSNKTLAAVMNDARVVEIDKTHVFYPRNTEYEIFYVGKKKHTLGALFILNHKTLFEEGLPPVRPIVQKARAEGALLELDKHNWPWSMMLAPVFNVDLYELANNHMWETDFAFRDFGTPAPDWMKIEKDAQGMTEWGWIDYTFKNYYSLRNCGLRMRPTAGCASGVHPVPLGFGRVYVKTDGEFTYDKWMKGLNEGRSFVTTGPMLFVNLDKNNVVNIRVESAAPASIRLIVNGADFMGVPPNHNERNGAYINGGETPLEVSETSWFVVQCLQEGKDGRVRWAHSAPIWIDVPGKPIRPRKQDVEFLMKQMETELARNKEVLTPEGLAEYQEALDFYKAKLKEAR